VTLTLQAEHFDALSGGVNVIMNKRVSTCWAEASKQA
jgi:hypothetical protein